MISLQAAAHRHLGDELPEYVTLAEAGRILSVSQQTVRRRIAEGQLTGFRSGARLVRVRRADVEGLLTAIPSA
jgi:excisionase family DNA binding protein